MSICVISSGEPKLQELRVSPRCVPKSKFATAMDPVGFEPTSATFAGCRVPVTPQTHVENHSGESWRVVLHPTQRRARQTHFWETLYSPKIGKIKSGKAPPSRAELRARRVGHEWSGFERVSHQPGGFGLLPGNDFHWRNRRGSQSLARPA